MTTELSKDERIAALETELATLTTNTTFAALTAANTIAALTATIALHVAFHAFVQRELRNKNIELAQTILECLVTRTMEETAELIRLKMLERNPVPKF